MVKSPYRREEEFPGQRAALREMRRLERHAKQEARREREIAKAFRLELAKEVELEQQRTRQERRIATITKKRHRIVRANSMQIRKQLRLERLLRLALSPPRPPVPPGRYPKPSRLTPAERAAKQRERDRIREEKRAARRAASRLPPLPYA